MERDYKKFLREDGALDQKLLPRKAYTSIVARYRQRPEIIDEVFEELYFAWDLGEKMKAQKERGEEVDKVAASNEVLAEMDDKDWWMVIGAFEKRVIHRFPDIAGEFSDILDPIYDDQEEHGWRKLQR